MADSANRLVVTEGQLTIINAGKPGPKGDTGDTGPQGPVGPSGAATAIVDAGSLAAMQSLGASAHQVLLQGGAQPLDGKTGLFIWDGTSTETADDVLVVAPSAGGTGRWRRWLPDGALNATWYGAAGDGTTDDTAALQAWLDACAALSRPGYLPPGSYLTGDLTIRGTALSGSFSQGIRVRGAGYDQSTLLAKSGTDALLTLAGPSGFTPASNAVLRMHLSDLTINGQATNANYGLWIDDGAGVQARFERLRVTNVTGTTGAGTASGVGVYSVDRAYSMHWQSVFCDACTIGMQLTDRFQDSKFVGCQFYSNTTAQAICQGVNQWTSNATFTGCSFDSSSLSTASVGIQVTRQNALSLMGCYFESHNVASRHVVITGGNLVSSVTIMSCWMACDTTMAYAISLPSDTTTIELALINTSVNSPATGIIENAASGNKTIVQVGSSGFPPGGYFPLTVQGGVVHLDTGLQFDGAAPSIDAGSGNLYLSYHTAKDTIVWNGGAGSGREILRATPAAGGGAVGVRIAGGSWIKGHLSATATWDPASVATGAMTSTTVTVTGAALGDTVAVGFTQAVPAGCLLVGAVTAINTVTVTLLNQSGATQDLASGTLRADCWKH